MKLKHFKLWAKAGAIVITLYYLNCFWFFNFGKDPITFPLGWFIAETILYFSVIVPLIYFGWSKKLCSSKDTLLG